MNHLLAVHRLSAANVTELVPAIVMKVTKVILMMLNVAVAVNVKPTMIALLLKPVYVSNALIPVKIFVVNLLSARSTIMYLPALVLLVILEIHSSNVNKYQ